MPALATLMRRALHVVLPVDCSSCGVPLDEDPVPFFCRQCWGSIHPLRGPACPRCGAPFASATALTYSPNHLCTACRLRPPSFTRAWSLYPYEGPLQDAIRLFKYHSKVALADSLGELMAAASRDLPAVDAIAPVPLHASRLRAREFNQSLLLADRLSRRLGVPLSYGNLIRLRDTQPQTELTRSARLKNLRRAFSVRHPEEVDGKHLLLVDDVFTTGTTVNECAKALRKAGAADVFVCTLARTM